MKNKIHLNKDTTIDIPKLMESRAVILANSGGGKSYAIRKVAEDAVSQVQTIILDPEGEFASLREKYDFILAGKGADVPVETRSAALLAIKLLELGKSAVIDLYELHPQERQRYVKIFCDALINCPKELYHSVLIILDEAHEYAPEGKPSEATWAVEALASKGRKRGFCLVPASQRIAKLSKNLSAECNNKLIGRASQDIDMKRAGDELGFSKDKLVQLRQLKPGEFFAFGPAISDEVIKVKIGQVKTTHAKVGYKHSSKVPLPSHRIAAVLAELKDLPQEAEKEAQTIHELKAQIRGLKMVSKQPAEKIVKEVVKTKIVEKPVFKDSQIKKLEKIFGKMYAEAEKHGKAMGLFWGEFNQIGDALVKAFDAIKENQKRTIMPVYDPNKFGAKVNMPVGGTIAVPKPMEKVAKEIVEGGSLNSGETMILKAIAQFQEGMTTEHIAVLTGYKKTSRVVYLQKLSAKGYIQKSGQLYFATSEGIEALGNNYEPLPTGDSLREHILRTIPEGEKKVLEVILTAYPNEVSGEHIEEQTGYKKTSRIVYVQKLVARKVVEKNGTLIKASSKLYD